jgi:CheY-like chemotaxis protein
MKILIIDSPECGRLVKDLLLNSGFFETCVFRHASKLSEVTDLILSQHFHCIIIDPSFSKDYGLAFIKTIKDYSPSTKIIALCLCSTDPFNLNCGQRCLSAGADYHLGKMKYFHLLPAIVRKNLNSYPGGSSNFVKAAPKKPFALALRDTCNVNGRLKTPSFLRAKRRKVI